jgi:hypothetical protein
MEELSKDSHVQLDQICTVDIEQRIVDTHGSVSQSQLEAIDDAILIQRENPAVPAKDERSDVSEPRPEQGGSESRTL